MALSTPVKTMIVSNSLAQGGAERFASRLACGLERDRVAPSLVLLRGDIDYAKPGDLTVKVLGYHHPIHFMKTVANLRRLLCTERPDLILGTGTSVNAVIGSALIGMRKRPSWIARVDIDRRDLWFRRRVLGLLYPMADAIVANSEGLKGAMKRIYPRQNHKITTLLNPVDFKQIDDLAGKAPVWTRRAQVPLLASAGRAHPSKRWDYLLEAFSKVVERSPAELVLCGDGPMLGQLKTRARSLGIAQQVHFLGRCTNPFSVLSQADLYIMGSNAEGLPNALIEAQGLGLCAIAANCDYGPEEIVVHGQTGLLVDVDDRDQFVSAMMLLLADEPLRKRMGARARQVARERFNYNRRCRQWEDLIVAAAHPAW